MLIAQLIRKKGLPERSHFWTLRRQGIGHIGIIQVNFIWFLEAANAVALFIKVTNQSSISQMVQVSQ
jgi:hypothetical protein